MSEPSCEESQRAEPLDNCMLKRRFGQAEKVQAEPEDSITNHEEVKQMGRAELLPSTEQMCDAWNLATVQDQAEQQRAEHWENYEMRISGLGQAENVRAELEDSIANLDVLTKLGRAEQLNNIVKNDLVTFQHSYDKNQLPARVRHQPQSHPAGHHHQTQSVLPGPVGHHPQPRPAGHHHQAQHVVPGPVGHQPQAEKRLEKDGKFELEKSWKLLRKGK